MYCIQDKGSDCSPKEEVKGGAVLLGDFMVIVCPISMQPNDFCDLLGTLNAPVLKKRLLKINYQMIMLNIPLF